jgi:3-oxoadipate enol-lactonase
MNQRFIDTNLGRIAVYMNEISNHRIPLVFLHGVYFDHHLWDNHLSGITDRQVIAIDMPLHGDSKTIFQQKWSLDDCANMLLEILHQLKIEKVIGFGHSWGSMTLIRAANKQPKRFAALGLCNMPFKQASSSEKIAIRLQHFGLMFPGFYRKQAANALMSKESRLRNPGLVQELVEPMSKLTRNEIIYTDKAVRIDAEDTASLIQHLGIPMKALLGETDYVGVPPVKDTVIVGGGHVSPLEAPEEVQKFIQQLMDMYE